MVETVAPVVYGDKRSRYRFALFLHVIAATLAAGVVGAVAGTIGLVLGAPWGTAGLIAVGAVAALYAFREVSGVPIPVPDRHKQVPLWWRTFYSPPVAGMLYGLGIGVGYLTFLSFGTYVAVTVAAAATGNVLLGAALTAPFGFGRGLSVAIANWRAGTEERPSGIDKVDALSETRWPKAANALVLGVIVVAASISLL
jgi:cytochrome c biogenesis protein CcdA